MEPILLWLKRDLRLADNPALARACALGAPVPVYIVEPGLWAQPESAGRHYAFLVETLMQLRRDLRALGSDLVIRHGAAVDQLEALRQETGARRMVSTQETGTGWSFARDRAVAGWAAGQGVTWEEMPHSAIRRGHHDRDHWSRHRNAVMARAPVAAPAHLPPVAVPSQPVPTAAALGLAPDMCPARQRGGRDQAEALLTSFLTTRGQHYRRQMSSPLTGAEACSRLSPYLALGVLSPREVAARTAARQRARRAGGAPAPRDGWSGSLNSLQSRLAWRDHFIQKLEDEPDLDRVEMHRACHGLRPAEPDTARLAAWESGETGVPFVDACMRSLTATGWLNFRMRAMLMSFASYHLWLPWQRTGLHLARLFTDYEPGIHWSQCQMQSGTTGINTPRIYNPVKQGREQDPTGAFTRRWCPELADVPDALLQEPWRWDVAVDYPEPIVDVADAARRARDTIWSLRKDTGFRAESQRVIRKHASRKDPQRHFVNDRAPKAASRSDDRQQSFDF
ncbi:DNA photolyase family protein [Mameliella alba]|nr:DNA photolyase family protein [Antarctobacter heliothermus]MBY6145537.1 DNA photolyase family protein [Mameliella alba]MCA0955545.1 DNA photolyase family protein [Mameliella alba]